MAQMKFNQDGTGTITFNGGSYSCRGKPGFNYTKDITLKPKDCYESKKSNEYGVWMNWCVGPIEWQKGAYIHSGSLDYSVGCVHLKDANAKKFYNFVKGRNSTRLITSYPW